jgi:hypothetical protein
MMKAPLRRRFWFEAGLASGCGFLAVLTLLWRDWIELFTGLDPDHSNGSFEWALVAGLVTACVLVGFAAGHEWRQARPAALASV